MAATGIRIDSIRPAPGRALVRVVLRNGLGMLASQQLDQCPNPMQALQAKPWDCVDQDQVLPGGGSA
ncbi:hypothetical protein ACGLHS_25175 [Variovorax sp. VaC1]|uniref:hypothetical protein n=1 Tax=Variovorax sp. VaC1 TaxID=3373132 RepID=UPI003749A422